MNRWKRILFSLFILFLALIIDGLIAFYGGSVLNTATGIMVPRLIVLVLVILTNYVHSPAIYYIAIAFGFIYDSYYVGFFGIYTVGFFATTYVLVHFWRQVYSSFIVYILAGLFSILMIEVFAFSIYHVLDITQWTLKEFFIFRLGATLVFNGTMMAFIFWPIDRIMKHFKDRKIIY